MEFNYGYTNYDTIFYSLFSIFMVSDGNWEVMWENMSDASGEVGALFFFAVVFITYNFFILRLAVAVMLDLYIKLKEKENKKKYAITAEMLKSENIDETLRKLAESVSTLEITNF